MLTWQQQRVSSAHDVSEPAKDMGLLEKIERIKKGLGDMEELYCKEENLARAMETGGAEIYPKWPLYDEVCRELHDKWGARGVRQRTRWASSSKTCTNELRSKAGWAIG